MQDESLKEQQESKVNNSFVEMNNNYYYCKKSLNLENNSF